MSEVEKYLNSHENQERSPRWWLTAILGYVVGVYLAYVVMVDAPRTGPIDPDAAFYAEDLAVILLAAFFGTVGWAAFYALSMLIDYPYFVATERRIPARNAIRVCAWFSLLFIPTWIVALIWALAAKPETIAAPVPKWTDSIRHDDQPMSPMARESFAPKNEPADTREYLVIGVSREDHGDVRWKLTAASAANAKVKAELRGAIVTEVTEAV